jgi:hypothetical protein
MIMPISPLRALNIREPVLLRPYARPQEADRVSSFTSVGSELRALDAYRIKSDCFSAKVTVTVNGVTKVARAVLSRSDTNGESSLLYFRVE